MNTNKQYKCVNCGEPSAALYKTYGPSVLKLTKCEKCNGIVDKYIEYDPVIVMIDLVLLSREAQRHVLYNTEFKGYWKLFIILLLIETYGLWHSTSLFNIAVNIMCDIQTNSSTLNITELSTLIPFDIQVPESLRRQCWGWRPEARDDEMYLWEEDFYVMFIATFAGVVAFIITVHVVMKIMQLFVTKKDGCPAVGARALARAAALGGAGALPALPGGVWRARAAAPPALAAAYRDAVYLATLTVVYERPLAATGLALAAGNCAKFLATLYAAPATRQLLRALRDLEGSWRGLGDVS